MTIDVAIVGLGMIGRCHVDALSRLGGVEVVAGADAAPDAELHVHDQVRPVYAAASALLDAHRPAVLVVATPTSAHAEVCREVAAHPNRPDRLLVEKPLSDGWADIVTMVGRPGVRCLYHAAYAPEVRWAVDRLPSWLATHGPVTEMAAAFTDPYHDRDRAILARTYGTSWLDAGINALSVAARLVTLLDAEPAVPVTGRFSTYSARIRFASSGRHGTGRITTSWDVDRAAKDTSVTFASGARLHLDHQRVQGRLDAAGEVVAAFELPPGGPPRLVMHYLGLYRTMLLGGRWPSAADLDDLLLHRLLLAPET